jgi:hypothetical protein
LLLFFWHHVLSFILQICEHNKRHHIFLSFYTVITDCTTNIKQFSYRRWIFTFVEQGEGHVSIDPQMIPKKRRLATKFLAALSLTFDRLVGTLPNFILTYSSQ